MDVKKGAIPQVLDEKNRQRKTAPGAGGFSAIATPLILPKLDSVPILRTPLIMRGVASRKN